MKDPPVGAHVTPWPAPAVRAAVPLADLMMMLVDARAASRQTEGAAGRWFEHAGGDVPDAVRSALTMRHYDLLEAARHLRIVVDDLQRAIDGETPDYPDDTPAPAYYAAEAERLTKAAVDASRPVSDDAAAAPRPAGPAGAVRRSPPPPRRRT